VVTAYSTKNIALMGLTERYLLNPIAAGPESIYFMDCK